MNELILYKEIITSSVILLLNVFLFEYFKRIFSLSNNNNQSFFNYLIKSWFETISWLVNQLRNENKIPIRRYFAGLAVVMLSILSVLGAMYKEQVFQGRHEWYSIGCLLVNYLAYGLFTFSKQDQLNKDYASLNSLLSFAVIFIHITLNMVFSDYTTVGSFLSLVICVFSLSYLVKDNILAKRNTVETLFISCFYISSLFCLLGFFNKNEMIFSISKFMLEQNLLVIIIGFSFSYLLNKEIKINEVLKTKYTVKLFVFASNIIVLFRMVLWKI